MILLAVVQGRPIWNENLGVAQVALEWMGVANLQESGVLLIIARVI